MSSNIAPWLPYTDRAGRTSWFKLAVFVACCAPALWIAYQWQAGLLSPKPVTDVLRQSGDWAIRFLVASLAVTPLRHATRWNRVFSVRRMLGLTSLFYTLAHVLFWMVQEDFVWITLLKESVLRTYLLVGWVATFIFIALGLTSNDASIRRLGAQGWNNLHWWVYPATLASLVHYFMLIRLDASQAALMAGLCTLFAGFRYLRKRQGDFGPVSLAALAAVAGLLTAFIEAGYYAFATGVDATRLLAAHLDFSYQVRPAWWVLLAGAIMALARVVKDWLQPAKPARKRP